MISKVKVNIQIKYVTLNTTYAIYARVVLFMFSCILFTLNYDIYNLFNL